MQFTINRLSDTAGEVVGLDCAAPLDADSLATLKRAMLDFPVVAIRDQTLAPRQQAAFSRQLGPLEAQDRKTYCHSDARPPRPTCRAERSRHGASISSIWRIGYVVRRERATSSRRALLGLLSARSAR